MKSFVNLFVLVIIWKIELYIYMYGLKNMIGCCKSRCICSSRTRHWERWKGIFRGPKTSVEHGSICCKFHDCWNHHLVEAMRRKISEDFQIQSFQIGCLHFKRGSGCCFIRILPCFFFIFTVNFSLSFCIVVIFTLPFWGLARASLSLPCCSISVSNNK